MFSCVFCRARPAVKKVSYQNEVRRGKTHRFMDSPFCEHCFQRISKGSSITILHVEDMKNENA